jgi:predicted acylesterase/phospholipase RssA
MNFKDESLYPLYTQPNGHFHNRTGGKTALVLAGGGITGAVYEIGALRALNDMLVDRTVNDFDIYVGTSAGSLVTSMLANGMTPEEMMQSIDNSHPEIRSIRANEIFQSNLTEFFLRFSRLPRALLRSGRNLMTGIGDRTLADLFWEFTDLLPAGLYSGAALERYVEEVLSRDGCVNRFDYLTKELYIIATDLDTGERTVFGKGGKGIVPISKAVAASSAIPIVYKPVRIFGREYVDGSMRGTASLDLAVEAGAELVVCINPLVPLNTQHIYKKDEHIGDEGMRTVINQVVRILMHAGLRYHIKSLRRQYPDVDFILIEPQPDDQKMFGYNLMDYSSRLRVANHGFESVTVGMTERYEYFSEIMTRHDIQISRGRVDAELREIQSGHHDTLLFEATPSPAPDQSSINQAMLSLESKLARLGQMLPSEKS